MTLTDWKLSSDNHFVAMEYYRLILNRTFLVLVTNDKLIGIKANGLVAAQDNQNPLPDYISNRFTVTDDLENPYSYLKKKHLDKYKNTSLLDGSILHVDKANFIINRSEILDTIYDSSKKWGMGYYPHTGKVYLKTSKMKKEFIILGKQSGLHIEKIIRSMKEKP